MDIRCIISQICEKIAAIATFHSGKKDSVWTKEILNEIGQLGLDKGFEVYPSCARLSKTQEWLYDLIWCKTISDDSKKSVNDNAHLSYVPLVLECEWNKNWWEIRKDFEKLLLANAALKVMIFSYSNDNNKDTYFADLKTGIEKYNPKRTGEYYLLIGIDNKSELTKKCYYINGESIEEKEINNDSSLS